MNSNLKGNINKTKNCHRCEDVYDLTKNDIYYYCIEEEREFDLIFVDLPHPVK